MEQNKKITQKSKKNTNIQKEFSQIGKQIKNYIITSQLGQGGFGTVWHGIDQNSGEQIAIKQVNKEVFKQNPKVKELFNCEIESLKKINNPNVVKYLDDFETKNNSYLVLEYCNDGNMEEYIENKPNQVLSEKEAISLFHQILNGYKALHEQNIIHRDLKLENILRHNDQIKLCDLGFAKQLNSPQETTKTILGTSVTMAPEILLGKKYGIEADIYSLGVILYCMVLGRYPYKANNDEDLIYMIKTEPLRLQRKNIKISPQLKDLLIQILFKF
ncbi:Protein kinase-like domain [Pseudocohnilembus persalinus]|uniref:Protein kinase-like domain n=1 Tax=Pseudocohnilembus persalinus TaxID=266149 RepID=A0A0V0Q8M1_PSEPJ|nr:Protein kinase-like domain [Pseudocohnilembus persalinus]|eukprot:KRW98506.1 Protein kinase-like domain [Pseudocohnilembus persalinus]